MKAHDRRLLENLLNNMLFEHGVTESHVSIRDHYCKQIEDLFYNAPEPNLNEHLDRMFVNWGSLSTDVLKVNVWVVLVEGHRPYVSTIEHTPGYYQKLKEQGATVVRAEIEIPGFQVDDGKVKSRTIA
jgi:hypothetical protein